jgi:hypothetical protein
MPTFREARRQKRRINDARAHPIAWMLRRVVAQAESIHAPATVWLHQLNATAPSDARARDDWPQTPEQLAAIFADLSEGLAALGVIISRTRAMLCGKVYRVWRVESVFNQKFNSNSRPLSFAAIDPHLTPIEAASATTSPAMAETDRENADFIGAPQMPTKSRKTTVEECARVEASEAPHVGAATVETQIGGTNARRLWAVCPQCARQVCYLYCLPRGEQWKCQRCHQLTTRARQQHGTRAAFDEWLTPERWESATDAHPATARLYEQMMSDWRENVAPLDWERADPQQRAELLENYATEKRARIAFEDARWRWTGRREERGAQVSAEIIGELWEQWKQHNRSHPK